MNWLQRKNITIADPAKITKTNYKKAETTLMDDSMVLFSWLNLALAEYTGCMNFTEDPQQLAKIFSVSKFDIQYALSQLIASGFIKRDEKGFLSKQQSRIRFPTSIRSREC